MSITGHSVTHTQLQQLVATFHELHYSDIKICIMFKVKIISFHNGHWKRNTKESAWRHQTH